MMDGFGSDLIVARASDGAIAVDTQAIAQKKLHEDVIVMGYYSEFSNSSSSFDKETADNEDDNSKTKKSGLGLFTTTRRRKRPNIVEIKQGMESGNSAELPLMNLPSSNGVNFDVNDNVREKQHNRPFSKAAITEMIRSGMMVAMPPHRVKKLKESVITKKALVIYSRFIFPLMVFLWIKIQSKIPESMKKVDKETGTNRAFAIEKAIEYWLTYDKIVKLCIASIGIIIVISLIVRSSPTRIQAPSNSNINSTGNSYLPTNKLPSIVTKELRVEEDEKEYTYQEYLNNWDSISIHKHEQYTINGKQCKSYVITEDGDNSVPDSLDHHTDRHKYEVTCTGIVTISDAAHNKRVIYQKYTRDPSFLQWRSYLRHSIIASESSDDEKPIDITKEIEIGYFKTYVYEGISRYPKVISFEMVYDLMDFACPFECKSNPCMSISAVQLGIDKNIILLNKDNEDDPSCITDNESIDNGIQKNKNPKESVTCLQERLIMIDAKVIFEDTSNTIEVLYDSELPMDGEKQEHIKWEKIPEMIVVEYRTTDGSLHKSKFHGKNAACILECIKISNEIE
jgi:hypothetical protein